MRTDKQAHGGGGCPEPRAGYTLLEMMVATGISGIVMVGLMGMFWNVARQTSYSQHIAWSHNEAIRSSRNIVSLLRNATDITAKDTNNWFWVEFQQMDGTRARFVHVNPIAGQRDGYMYLSNSVGTSMVVARGMTKIMTPIGFSPPIFSIEGTNALRIRYRVVEPVPQQPGQNQDDRIGAWVDTAVCLRNVRVQ